MAFDLSMPILVVDDYGTMIRIIRNLLKQIGFENVDDASDGSAALARMQARRYGLVISDWNMEPMTGYDLLREVRASPELWERQLIKFTALAEALAVALRARGVPDPAAILAAESGVTALRVASDRWIANPTLQSLRSSLAETLAALRAVASPSVSTG